MKTQDCLGRWMFQTHTSNPIEHFHPNTRQLHWMRWLNLHGLASSKYLHELTADTHQCSQTSKRMLRKLFDGGMIYKPRQQRATENADSNYQVYALTKSGINYLKDEGLWVEAMQLTGPWVHQYMVACITTSIHILSIRAGYTFIPGHEITNNLAVEIPYQWNRKIHSCKLIPDSLFAIQYPSGYIAYLIEADRGTEPNDPASPFRKSIRRNIKQYAEFVGNGQYKKAYRLKCQLVVLNVMVSNRRVEQAMKVTNEEIGTCPYVAFGIASEFKTPFQPPRELLSQLFNLPLARSGLKPYMLGSSCNKK